MTAYGAQTNASADLGMCHLLAMLPASSQAQVAPRFHGGTWNKQFTACTFATIIKGQLVQLGTYRREDADAGAMRYDCMEIVLKGRGAITNFARSSYSPERLLSAAVELQNLGVDVSTFMQVGPMRFPLLVMLLVCGAAAFD
jgi:hypothetical protein